MSMGDLSTFYSLPQSSLKPLVSRIKLVVEGGKILA
jgi:hypothetical protein